MSVAPSDATARGLRRPRYPIVPRTSVARDPAGPAVDGARRARSSRAVSSSPSERLISVVPLSSPTLASAEAAGILDSPPDIGALIARLRA